MTFEIGEKVVYPNQGVGTIENISSRSFGTQFEKFYLLRLVYTSMTVMVPFSNVGNIGLRKITKNAEIGRVLGFLSNGSYVNCSDWKCRFKQNTDKMQSGNLLQIAEVLKGLLVLNHQKTLSFREKKMLDRARHMLVSELSIARGLRESDAVGTLQKALAKSSLALPCNQ
ncbi:MAG: CarD family transcriptional regulator [Acidobacteriota bacterium]|nr:CarD family transcriptional regulator [Acidobacteriota bacterium]